MRLKHEALLTQSPRHLCTTFLFLSCCCFCHFAPVSQRRFGSRSLGRGASIKPELRAEGVLANKEVIREDESVVFTPLLCNNKDRVQRRTKGNDGLYTALVGAAVRGANCVSKLRKRLRCKCTALDPPALPAPVCTNESVT